MERFPVLAARPGHAEAAPPTVAPRGSTPPAPGRSRLTLVLMLLGTVILLGSVAITFLTLPSSPSVPSEPQAPGRRAVAIAYVDVEGGVRPLYPAVPGRVIAAPVPEGREVESGAVLLQIDDALAQARLKEAKVELRAAQERLMQAKRLVAHQKMRVIMQTAALDAARRKLDAAEAQARKVQRHFQDRTGGSREDVDAATQLVAEARAGVRVEQAKLEMAELIDPQAAVRLAEFDVASKSEQVEKAELGVRECKILAPCKGVILRRMVNVGEVVGPTQNRPAIEFCPSGDRIVRAEVEQEFARELYVGQKARISDDITGEGEWHGVVERISDWYTRRRAVLVEPMQYNDIRTLEVILRLTENDPKNPLRINQRVRVRLDDGP